MSKWEMKAASARWPRPSVPPANAVRAAIKLVVLQRVDDVESDQPEDHRGRQNGGAYHSTENRRPLHRQPCADRRQSQRESQKDMGEIREPFGQRIKADHQKSHGRKVKARAVDKITGGHKARAA